MSTLTHSDVVRRAEIINPRFEALPHSDVQYSDATPPLRGLLPWQLRAVLRLMADHLHENLPVSALAERARISSSCFSRGFRQSTGISPHQWLLRARVERAIQLIQDTKRPLADIAGDVGFADQAHFTRSVSRLTGVTPGAWRRGATNSRHQRSQ